MPAGQLISFCPFVPNDVSVVNEPPTDRTRDSRVRTYHSTPIRFAGVAVSLDGFVQDNAILHLARARGSGHALATLSTLNVGGTAGAAFEDVDWNGPLAPLATSGNGPLIAVAMAVGEL